MTPHSRTTCFILAFVSFLLGVALASAMAVSAQTAPPATTAPAPETINFSGPVFDGEGWLLTVTGERAIGFTVYNGTLAEVELVSISDSRQPLVCSQQPGAFVCLALIDNEVPPSITLRVTGPEGLTLPITVSDSSRTIHHFSAHLQRGAVNLDCAYLPLVAQ